MKKIVLTRIDDRLIHGQVITAWLKHVGGDEIIIVDHDLAKNKLMQRIYVAAAPSNVRLKILDVDECVRYFAGDETPAHCVLLVKIPQTVELLIDKGVPIENIILGGMGSNSNRKKFIRNVFADENEIKAMKRIIAHGYPISFQLVPDEKSVDIEKLV